MQHIFKALFKLLFCNKRVSNKWKYRRYASSPIRILNSILLTSMGTRRCPGLPMAKPDSNFVYYITKKGGQNKLWKCIRVKYAPCYVQKDPQLTQKHTRARRKRQHCEWIQCLLRQLIGKQRHVTKLECYRLFEMSLKFFVFLSGAGM